MADIYERSLFFNHAVFCGAEKYFQPSSLGLRKNLKSMKKNNHKVAYPNLIECLLNDICDGTKSTQSENPRFWRFEIGDDGKSGTVLFKIENRTFGRIADKFFVRERVLDTPENKKKYHESEFYRRYGHDHELREQFPVGEYYESKTGYVTFTYGFSEHARNLFASFSNLALRVLKDEHFLSMWIHRMVRILVPELRGEVEGLHVSVSVLNSENVRIETNLNVERFVEYHNRVAPERFPEAMTDRWGEPEIPAMKEDILVWLVKPLLYEIEYFVRTCIEEKGVYNATFPFGVFEFFKNVRRPGHSEITEFLTCVIGECGTIREKIISEQAQPMELLKLYERSDRWRQWASQISDDSNLIREYIKEISQDPWISRLSMKSLRFITVTGVGVAADVLGAGGLGTAAGVGIGAIDHFLVDYLVRGYSPKEFVTQIENL